MFRIWVLYPYAFLLPPLRFLSGGRFSKGSGLYDGGKFVCVDDLPSVPPGGEDGCLVYSFGLKDDVSFETKMIEYGEDLPYVEILNVFVPNQYWYRTRATPTAMPLLVIRDGIKIWVALRVWFFFTILTPALELGQSCH